MSYITVQKRGRSPSTPISSQQPTLKKAANLTTSPTTNILDIDIANHDIIDLPDVYPPLLERFNCSNNHITDLPLYKMPPTLKTIIASNNEIESLPFIPSTMALENIIMDHNKLTKLPPLPVGLQTLSVAHNYLVHLPAILPTNTLRVLNVKYNTLTALPLEISKCHQLSILICNDNNLSQIPTLPASLVELNISHNPVRILPLLPIGLLKLNISNTSINSRIIELFNGFDIKNVEEKRNLIQETNATLYPHESSQTPPVLISQGAYGCAYRPSIKCADSRPKDYYDNKIAKLMVEKDAIRENAEYAEIAAADPKQQYYLGIPDMCVPEPSYTDYIHNCNAIKRIRPDDRATLLIMQNGGDNIAIYTDKLKSRINALQERGKTIDRNTTFTKHTDRFLLAFYKLMHGLQMLRDNNLIHLDIKPQNIVYNIENGEMKFIDFGMLGKLSDYMESKKGVKSYWWSYPWEFEYAAPDAFRKLLKGCNMPVSKEDMENDGIDDALFSTDDKQHFFFFESIYNLNLNQNAPNIRKYVQILENIFDNTYNPDLTEFFLKIQEMTHHSEFPINIDKITDKMDIENTNNIKRLYVDLYKKSYLTFDLYGMGITLMYYLYRLGFIIPEVLLKDLLDFTNGIITPNVFKRDSVDSAIQKLRQLLLTHGIADRNPDVIHNLGITLSG